LSQLITTIMSETQQVVAETAQSQTVTTTTPTKDPILDRLSQDFDFSGAGIKTPETEKTLDQIEGNKTETTTELKPEEKEALLKEAKDLGLPETATKEEIEAKKAEIEAAKPKEDEWSLENTQTQSESDESTWANLIKEMGYEVPADFSEEQGFEALQKLNEAKFEQRLQEATKMHKEDLLSEYPAEARMVMDLLKSGQTLEQLNQPFFEIAFAKSMSDEEMVRAHYEAKIKSDGWDADMVDHKMQSLDESSLAIEAKILRKNIDNYEKSLTDQRKQQLEIYTNNQKELQAQKATKANLELKTALDRVPEFLGKKLPDAVKGQLLQELQSDAYRNMPGTPEQKVDYFLYQKFGKQALKSYQDRVQEQLTLEKKKTELNVPPVTSGNANYAGATTQNNNVEDRLKRDFGG
jgi:hypothetical protein